MPKYRIRTTRIDYCIEDEDVCEYVPEDQIEAEIERIKSSLPQHMVFTIECDKDDLDDMVCDAIGNETGWLINSFDYEQL